MLAGVLISCVPQCITIDVPEACCVILASDGLWDALRCVISPGLPRSPQVSPGLPRSPLSMAFPSSPASVALLSLSLACSRFLLPALTFSRLLCSSGCLFDALSFASAAKVALAAKDPSHAAEKLVNKSIRARGLRDDITAVVLVCGHAPPIEAAHAAVDAESDHTLEAGSSEGKKSASPRAVRRFGLSSLLRTPGRVGTQLSPRPPDPSVKGGKLFESLAREAGGMRRNVSNDSLHSATSVSSADSHTPTSPHAMRAAMANGTQSPPMSPGSNGKIPLFAFMESGGRISPSGSRENSLHGSSHDGSSGHDGLDSFSLPPTDLETQVTTISVPLESHTEEEEPSFETQVTTIRVPL